MTVYALTRTCTLCGFKHTERRQVHGDFDGWDDDRLRMAPKECPFCIHAKKLRINVKAAIAAPTKITIHPNSLATLAKHQMPLGETQREVLRSLAKPSRGFWYSGCGWLWDTPSGTRKIMETLLKRGLVTKTMVPYTHTPDCTYPRYDLTDEGRRVAQEKP